MRTGELTAKLLSHYHTTEAATTNPHIAATQVRSDGTYADATADAVIIGNWPSKGYLIEGFEVKVSRSDWLSEVKSPDKCLPIKKYCNRFWLVISDASFVKDGELPDDWGMMAVVSGNLKVIKDAPELSPLPPSVAFITGLMRSNKRDVVSIDVANDMVKDAARDVEQAMKAKYEELLNYVKFINSGLGIEMKWTESWSSGDYKRKWVAQLKRTTRTYTQDELLAVFKAAIANDLEDIGYKMWSAREDAKKVLEITDKVLKDTNSKWGLK